MNMNWVCLFFLVFAFLRGAVVAADRPPLSYVLEDSVGGFGSVLGYFHFPAGISGDSQSIYIADSGNNRIVKTDFYFVQMNAFQAVGDSERSLDRPWGVAVSGTSVWVSDTRNHRLLRYSSYGVLQKIVGELGIFDGDFDTPKGLDASFESLWVADFRNRRIQQFHGESVVRSFGAWGDISETVTEPQDIVVLPTQELIVSDQRRLRIFTNLGQWVQDILPQFSEGASGFGFVRGVGVNQDGPRSSSKCNTWDF